MYITINMTYLHKKKNLCLPDLLVVFLLGKLSIRSIKRRALKKAFPGLTHFSMVGKVMSVLLCA